MVLPVKHRICILTYDIPHLKTAQVLLGSYNRGFRGIDLLLMPFNKRPERTVILRHRPAQFEGPDPRSLANFIGGSVFEYEKWPRLQNNYDWFLVCGSNLIEPSFADSGKILNVHSGLIPSVRGLDSFKWAILHGQPLGNTLHKIDSRPDAGEVVCHLPTPVFPEDDLKTLAQRHYENEIWMLANFDSLLQKPFILALPENEPTMRMPVASESGMVRAFDDYKRQYAPSARGSAGEEQDAA